MFQKYFGEKIELSFIRFRKKEKVLHSTHLLKLQRVYYSIHIRVHRIYRVHRIHIVHRGQGTHRLHDIFPQGSQFLSQDLTWNYKVLFTSSYHMIHP